MLLRRASHKQHIKYMNKNLFRYPGFLIAGLAGILLPSAAWAQAATSRASIGGMIASLGNDAWLPIVLLLWSGSMLVGTFLVASGLFKVVSSVGRDEIPMKEVIGRLLGGGALVAFWDALRMGPMTMFGSLMTTVGWDMRGPMAPVGGLTNCLTGSSGGVACMARNFSTNVVPAFMAVAWCMSFIWGAWLILTAVHAMATDDGRGGGGKVKPWVRIIFGAILCQLPLFIGSISASLGFGTGVVDGGGMIATDSVMLAYKPPENWGLLSTYSDLIGYVFVIMAMFGVAAVVRGISHLKAGAEGGQQGTTGSGLTHIIGGAMMVNAKATTCLVVSTFLGQGLNFCG